MLELHLILTVPKSARYKTIALKKARLLGCLQIFLANFRLHLTSVLVSNLILTMTVLVHVLIIGLHFNVVLLFAIEHLRNITSFLGRVSEGSLRISEAKSRHLRAIITS